MSATVSFVKDATTATINGPQRNQPLSNPRRHVTGLTPGGVRYVYKTTSHALRQWRLTFDLTAAQKTALENFFYSTVDGPASAFSYTDTEGTTYTARFVDPELSFQRLGPNEFTTQVTLEINGAIV